MKRRNFLGILTLGSGVTAITPILSNPLTGNFEKHDMQGKVKGSELSADLVIAGGGLGGCAAALAALRNNLRVILTEQTDWIGGQLTSQGVPPDEHPWIETHGCTQLYRDFRTKVRDYYKKNYPLTKEASSRTFLNPGDGVVSNLCHEPKVALAVLQEMFAPYVSSGKLTVLLNHRIISAIVHDNEVHSLSALNMVTGDKSSLKASYFLDATELGDILPLTGTEYVTGTESKAETHELHAPEKGDPENIQAFTVTFAMDYVPGEDFTIMKPADYDFWHDYIPKVVPQWSGKLLALSYPQPSTLVPKKLGFDPLGPNSGAPLNLWVYRRIINKKNFQPGTYSGDISIVNWPQNDFFLGNLIGTTPKDFELCFNKAKQLSLSLLYWLQTEATRPDGGKGWPGLRLRKDIMGTEDGLAKYPYIRESRRIKAVFTILEEHVGVENRTMVTGNPSNKAADFYDSVGVGYYHVDLHPTCKGNNYIDFASMPFQIPLGALLPIRMKNLLPANKNIGTTHITNGCYRLHPVEWNIGESAGLLAAFALNKKVIPRIVRERKEVLTEFQDFIRSQGVETHWPEGDKP